jgi:pimeloyl-ACP methyl ester carboxylesterase
MARVILVHGAWHGGWCWDRLVPLLEKAGHTVELVDLPSSGRGGDLLADAALVRHTIERSKSPTVVVGHSYGGMVITEGAAGCPQVSHLVYLCAFMLDRGQSLLDQFGGKVSSWVQVDPETGNSRVLDAVPVFYADVDREGAEGYAARLAPQNLKSFVDRLTQAAWEGIPSTYVVCTQDQAIPHAVQQAMSARAGAVRTLESSHSPFMSQPGEVAAIIDAVAR